MIPYSTWERNPGMSPSRASGGDPKAIAVYLDDVKSFPRERGVIPMEKQTANISVSPSRASGGDPENSVLYSQYKGSFPRERG